MDVFKEWSFSTELPFLAGVLHPYSIDFLRPLLNLAVQPDFEGKMHDLRGIKLKTENS